MILYVWACLQLHLQWSFTMMNVISILIENFYVYAIVECAIAVMAIMIVML